MGMGSGGIEFEFTGSDDEELAKYIKKNYTYKEIGETLAEWVENIEITNQARMVKVYDGNIKDYETRLRIHYVYQNSKEV